MKVLQFKCTLLSDVILNKKYATAGSNETLDFIPGNNFLGITASKLYSELKASESMTLFHSGKVRFGDAHPSASGIRGLRVPASMFYPKLSSAEKELFIHHHLPSEKDLGGLQLKQCRTGFYIFFPVDDPYCAGLAEQVRTDTDFAIKSAYDRELRRSKDEQLFGYQSLRKGLTMYFSIEIDTDVEKAIPDIEEKIKRAIAGERTIGRSRSAQYGLIRIEPYEYSEAQNGVSSEAENDSFVAVYADSRLIFIDEDGLPSFQPNAEQLGLKGEIDWKKSQVRTFCYAPWNFKRQSFDTDRCGIEKGSVFVVKVEDGFVSDLKPRYVGGYNNEGFGRILYNPLFLKAGEEGKAIYRFAARRIENKNCKEETSSDVDTPLIRFLLSRKNYEEEEKLAYEMVNDFVKRYSGRFSNGEFSSQWGAIRSMATSSQDIDTLQRELFEESDSSKGYLVHGIAKDKWAGERLRRLKAFIIEAEEKFNPVIAKQAIVNLASEMAKDSRKKK